MYTMQGPLVNQIQLTLPSMKCVFISSFCLCWRSRWEITQQGKPLFSPAQQHSSFNHLHIIIRLPQAMNYSVLGFCHENSERIACSSSLLFLSLLLLSLFPSARSSSRLHCCHSGRGRTAMGRNHPPPVVCTCSIPWRHLNAETEAGLRLLCQKKSTRIIAKQNVISRNSAHKIRKKWTNFMLIWEQSGFAHAGSRNTKCNMVLRNNCSVPSLLYIIPHVLRRLHSYPPHIGPKIWAADSSPPASCDKKWWGIQMHRKVADLCSPCSHDSYYISPHSTWPHDLRGAINRLQSNS